MSDYKELIAGVRGDAAFRHIISECGADGKVWFDKRFICDYVSHLKYTIEQLVNDRNASMDALKALHDNGVVVDGTPCDFCTYNPPSSLDGKPCTMCPACKRREGGSDGK